MQRDNGTVHKSINISTDIHYDPNGVVTFHSVGYAEKCGMPDEMTTAEMLTREIDRLLNASR